MVLLPDASCDDGCWCWSAAEGVDGIKLETGSLDAGGCNGLEAGSEVSKGGTLDGGCECGVASGEGATEAGEARKAPTLLILAPAPPLVL